MNKPKNENYAGIVAEIKSIIPLEGMNNVVHTNLFGNLVIVGKDCKEGDIGIFFPIETQLTEKYLSENNLYRKQELNKDQTLKGYFEENGRIRAMKFAGKFKSMGLFMPLSSLDFAGGNNLNVGDLFDEINGIEICRKYFNKKNEPKGPNQQKTKKVKESKIVDGAFKFHYDTAQLGRNIDHIKPESVISITQKIHGTSWISSKVLCKKRLNIIEKTLKFLGVKIVDTQYDNIYSSRKVIKNEDFNTSGVHYYDTDIWGLVNEKVKDKVLDGMTLYGEAVGYTPSGKAIQGAYDYGCQIGEFDYYVYRIIMSNASGYTVEFTTQQVKNWCKENGIKSVVELYYGKAKTLFPELNIEDHWNENFLKRLQETYLEKDCWNCKNKVPDEGIVVRVEDTFETEALKLKSFRFLEGESKSLDSGEVDMETQES